MVTKTAFIKYRILMITIGLSFVLHLFWLSAVKVVVAPPASRPVKISRVSFLGPLLTRTATEVRIAGRPRAFLEERYNALAGEMPGIEGAGAGDIPSRRYNAEASSLNTDEKFASLVDSAVSGRKLEPSFL